MRGYLKSAIRHDPAVVARKEPLRGSRDRQSRRAACPTKYRVCVSGGSNLLRTITVCLCSCVRGSSGDGRV